MQTTVLFVEHLKKILLSVDTADMKTKTQMHYVKNVMDSYKRLYIIYEQNDILSGYHFLRKMGSINFIFLYNTCIELHQETHLL